MFVCHVKFQFDQHQHPIARQTDSQANKKSVKAAG